MREIFAAARGNKKRLQEDVAVIIEDIKCSTSKTEAIFNAEKKSIEIEWFGGEKVCERLIILMGGRVAQYLSQLLIQLKKRTLP